MIDITLRRLMKKWQKSQIQFAELNEVNRGSIQSYLRENPAKPNIEFMINLEKLTGGKISARQLWENNFDDEDIPPQPILDGSILPKGKDVADMKLEEAFKIIMKEMIKLREDLKRITGEE